MTLPQAEAALNGLGIEDDLGAVLALAAAKIDPPLDPHAPPEYRRAVFSTLLDRAAKQALSRVE
jgi:carbon-monoxide dehydrogenase medium subunit